MRRSTRRRGIISGDEMSLDPNGGRGESSNAAVQEVVSTVASSSNAETDVRLNGRKNLRKEIQTPKVKHRLVGIMMRPRPSVASSTSKKSGKKVESAAGASTATNQVGNPTLNAKDDQKQETQNPSSDMKESKPELDGLAKAEGNGEASWNATMVVQSQGSAQPPSAHATKEQEFRNFLEMDAAANRIDRPRNLDSNSNYANPSEPFTYHPLGGESLLRRALTGKCTMPGPNYPYNGNGIKPTANLPTADLPAPNVSAANLPRQNGVSVNNEGDNSDVDVEMVDERVAGVSPPNNLNGLINPDEANVGTGSRRSVRNSTAQKRKLLNKDANIGFSRDSLENSEKLLVEMSKQAVWAFVQKESRKPNPDFSKLSEALDITYDVTRKSMYDSGLVDVKDIKKKFPALLHYQMVKEELGRILKDPRKMERLEKELDKEVLSSALEGKKKTLCPGKKRHPIWKKSVQLWEEKKGSVNSAEYRKSLGMIAVCFEFAENAVVARLCKILKQNENLSCAEIKKMDVPVIVVRESQIFNVFDESDIWIYVDGQKYIKVPNMYEAVLTVFAVYYIFNIAYDKSLKSLFEFFDYLCDNPQSTYPKAD